VSTSKFTSRKPVARKAPVVKARAAKPATPAAEAPKAAKPVETAVQAAPETVKADAAPVAETAGPVADAVAQAPVQAVPASPEPESIPEPARMADSVPAAPVNMLKGQTNMTDAMETAKTYAEEAKTRIQGAMSDMNEKTRTAMEKSARAFEELGELTKGNLEAIVESSKIAAKGVETMSQDAAEFGRKSFEKTSATMKSLAAVKTPVEFFQLQSELLSTTLDAFAAEASKNSEMMLKLVGEIGQPISSRVSLVTEKMKSLAA